MNLLFSLFTNEVPFLTLLFDSSMNISPNQLIFIPVDSSISFLSKNIFIS